MKNFEIKSAIETLNGLDSALPVRASFAIAKNLRALKEAESLFDEEHDRLVKKYAADGKQVRPTDDIDGFTRDLVELSNLDADIDFKKVRYDDIKDLEFTVRQMEALMYMMEG